MDIEVEIIIQSDGSLMVPRGSNKENDVVFNLVSDPSNSSSLSSFFSATEDSELLFGDSNLCG